MSSPHYKGSNQPNLQLGYIQVEGDKAIIIKPRALDITWGGDNRYWRWDTKENTAELVQVSWLEVNGSVDMASLASLASNTKYKLEFKVKLKPDAFGWNDSPVYVMVKPGKGSNYMWKTADLSKMKEENKTFAIPSREFTVSEEAKKDKLMFGLFEIWKGRWKGGLVIEEVIISKA